MSDMLTSKDVQELLQVDRSTVYRMAEAGKIPAIKIGKQWRFPSEQIQEWLSLQMGNHSLSLTPSVSAAQTPNKQSHQEIAELVKLLPLECIQLIQDSHADLLGIMLLITDMDGNPITEPSNPCGLFSRVNKSPDAIKRCMRSWHDLGQALNIEPSFQKSHLGLLCARGLIRVGSELKGMVVAGCIAPEVWPPNESELMAISAEFDVPSALIKPHLHEVYTLNREQKSAVLTTVQKVADIVAHIVQERRVLVEKLDAISSLARL